jgi:NADH-quinone oxidoreductase subunit M
LLGLVTINSIGLSGAVLQMFSHGIIAGLLFAVVGRMVYDRTHTRDLGVLEGMNLGNVLPFAAGTFVIAAFASMGLPGFSGFAAEMQVLIGAWYAFPRFALLAGFGILVGVAYTLRVFAEHDAHPLPPISVSERIGAAILLGAIILIGLYPKVLLDLIGPSFDTPLFKGLREGAGL